MLTSSHPPLCRVVQVLSVSKHPLLCSTPTRCVSPLASVFVAFNVCSAVEVDKRLGFKRRRRGKARCLTISAKGSASPPRREQDDGISGGLTRSLRKLHVRRCNM